MELPVAVVTTGRGIRLVPVEERDGILVDRETGSELELVELVVVFGLPELVAS